MKKYSLFFLIFLFMSVISLCISFGYWFKTPQNNQTTVVDIPKGSSVSQITHLLSQQKVLSFPLFFKGFLYISMQWKHLKAGEYFIPAHVTPAQLIHILKSGNVILHPITVIEGETNHQVVQKLMNNPLFTGECLLPQEGSLLPETYSFPKGKSRQKIIDHLQNSMSNALGSLWAQRPKNHPLTSLQELVILASIVEKETALPQERPLIAAVFLNRLKLGMRLQADPTVIYGVSQSNPQDLKYLTRDHLKLETPYNTYLFKGLPPTPIANPSLDSLKAVLHPASVSYLYFVADGTGGHVFATNLKDHQKNHALWRKKRLER